MHGAGAKETRRHAMIEQRTISVFGHVQGVNLRSSARAVAERLRITGFARNQPDGSVRIWAEGRAAALDELVAWCRIGPPSARVDRVVVASGEPTGHASFTTG